MIISTDASAYGLGAVFSQVGADDQKHTVAFEEVVAKWIERWTCDPRLWVRISAPAGIVHDTGPHQLTERVANPGLWRGRRVL